MDAYLEQARHFAGEDAMEETMAGRQRSKRSHLDDARERLVEVQGALEGVLGHADPMVTALRAELQQLLGLIQSPELQHEAAAAARSPLPSSSSSPSSAGQLVTASEASSAAHATDQRADDGADVRGAPPPPPSRHTARWEGEEEAAEGNPMAALLGPLAVSIRGAVEALQAIQLMIAAAAEM
ncbi:hypothetical protein ACP4OV_009084 [Aristida adscensionis]